MTGKTLSTTRVTKELRSYLRSVLAMKVSCAPKGKYAYSYKFSNQE